MSNFVNEQDNRAWEQSTRLLTMVAQRLEVRAQAEPDLSLQSLLRETARLINNLVAAPFPQNEVGQVFLPRWIGDGLQQRLQLEQQLSRAVELLGDSEQPTAVAYGEVMAWLSQAYMAIVSQYEFLPLTAEVEEFLRRYWLDVQKLQATYSAIMSERSRHELADLAVRAESAAVASEVAAGDSGAIHLGSYFLNYSEDEQKRARHHLWGMLGLVLLTVGVGVVLLVVEDKAPPTQMLLARLGVALPVLLAAIFVGRLAAVHTSAARQARELGVRLRTLPAYTAELDHEERRAIRSTFAQQVFDVRLNPHEAAADPAAGGLWDLVRRRPGVGAPSAPVDPTP